MEKRVIVSKIRQHSWGENKTGKKELYLLHVQQQQQDVKRKTQVISWHSEWTDQDQVKGKFG